EGAVALVLHVVDRSCVLDAPHLREQCRKLARHILPLDPVRVADDLVPLLVGRTAEVGEQSTADPNRLAHVEELVARPDHAVHPGPGRGTCPYFGAGVACGSGALREQRVRTLLEAGAEVQGVSAGRRGSRMRSGS